MCAEQLWGGPDTSACRCRALCCWCWAIAPLQRGKEVATNPAQDTCRPLTSPFDVGLKLHATLLKCFPDHRAPSVSSVVEVFFTLWHCSLKSGNPPTAISFEIAAQALPPMSSIRNPTNGPSTAFYPSHHFRFRGRRPYLWKVSGGNRLCFWPVSQSRGCHCLIGPVAAGETRSWSAGDRCGRTCQLRMHFQRIRAGPSLTDRAAARGPLFPQH